MRINRSTSGKEIPSAREEVRLKTRNGIFVSDAPARTEVVIRSDSAATDRLSTIAKSCWNTAPKSSTKDHELEEHLSASTN